MQIFYEQGGVRFAHFFRFLAVSCVFICVNAALLYPDNITALATFKLNSNKEKTAKQTPKSKPLKKLSEIRNKLEKCKSCLGKTEDCCSKTQIPHACIKKSEERNNLLPNDRPYVDSSRKYTECAVSERSKDNCNIGLTKTETAMFPSSAIKGVLDVPSNHGLSTYILGTKLTYTECPPAVNTNLNSLSNAQSLTSLGEGRETRNGHSCQEDTKQICKPEEVKPCRWVVVQLAHAFFF